MPPRSSSNTARTERWFPSREQLRDPESLERTLRQVLTQHYALVDRIAGMASASTGTGTGKAEGAGAPASESGPSTTKLLGLHVEPIDTETLANGATLKYNKTRGTFSFQ